MLTIQLSPFQALQTQRLVLREIRPADAEDLFLLRSNKEANKYQDKTPPAHVGEIIKFIETIGNSFLKNESITWAIILKGEDKLIGTVGFWRIDTANHRAEIGYMLHPDHWNKGIITEALTAVFDFGFRQLKFHSVEANLNPDNIASVKTIEKQGFVKEGYFKENFYYKGKFLDSLIYSKLAPKD